MGFIVAEVSGIKDPPEQPHLVANPISPSRCLCSRNWHFVWPTILLDVGKHDLQGLATQRVTRGGRDKCQFSGCCTHYLHQRTFRRNFGSTGTHCASSLETRWIAREKAAKKIENTRTGEQRQANDVAHPLRVKERKREREKERKSERERQRKREREKERKREREKERKREREKERKREREKERKREREKERKREREKERKRER